MTCRYETHTAKRHEKLDGQAGSGEIAIKHRSLGECRFNRGIRPHKIHAFALTVERGLHSPRVGGIHFLTSAERSYYTLTAITQGLARLGASPQAGNASANRTIAFSDEIK